MSYKNFLVWNKAVDAAVIIHQVTSEFPYQERYEIGKQMRRAATSIISNIAEGYRRKTTNDRAHYFRIAFGSASEIESQMALAERLRLHSPEKLAEINDSLGHVLRLLNLLCRSVITEAEITVPKNP